MFEYFPSTTPGTTDEEGGAEHVGGDLFSPAIDYIADWVAEDLAANG